MQPEARARIIARISWLTGRGQQSDSYTYLSSVTRYLPELASLSSFARILKLKKPTTRFASRAIRRSNVARAQTKTVIFRSLDLGRL